MSEERDYLEEALSLVDGDSPLLAERAHLVALHRHHTKLLNMHVTQLLRLLEAEHSHVVPNCDTCLWIEQQPEWGEIVKTRRQND